MFSIWLVVSSIAPAIGVPVEISWEGGSIASGDPDTDAAVICEYSSNVLRSDNLEFPEGGPWSNIDIRIGKCCSIDEIEPACSVICYKLIDTRPGKYHANHFCQIINHLLLSAKNEPEGLNVALDADASAESAEGKGGP